MSYRFETLDIAGVTMKGLIDITLIGLVLIMHSRENELAFPVAIALCFYLVGCQWYARWKIFTLESEVREGKATIDALRKYNETMLKHRKRVYDS